MEQVESLSGVEHLKTSLIHGMLSGKGLHKCSSYVSQCKVVEYKAFFVQIHWLFFRGKKLKNPKFSQCKMHWQNLVSLETLNVFRHIRLLFQLLIKHFNLILCCDSST